MTINEIAKLANTSRGTVDRVVNKRGKVNKELEDKIKKIIEETGFVPNEVARSLAMSNKKVSIGLVIGSINNCFFELVIEGIKNQLEKYKNYGMLLDVIEVELFDTNATLDAIEKFSKKKINLLIVSISSDERIISKLDELDIPIIALNIDIESKNKIAFVGTDYYNSGLLAANLVNLILPNGKSIGVVAGSLAHNGQNQRLSGFKDELKPSLEIIGTIENFDNDEKSYLLTKEFLAKNNMDLIYFLGSGVGGGLKALKESKKKNRPIAITVDQCDEVVKGLKTGLVSATITQHPYTQGVKAIDLAYEHLIKNKKIIKTKMIENSIILKESIIPHKIKQGGK